MFLINNLHIHVKKLDDYSYINWNLDKKYKEMSNNLVVVVENDEQ